MGNFYANLAMRSADGARVAGVLESHDRNAYVATVGDSTFVYDERCDTEDLDELRSLALAIARDLAAPVLAVCNHDDDVLWIALADSDGVTEVYDPAPGYFEGGSDLPRIANLDMLCRAFGVTARAELEAALKTPHSEVVFEYERHRKLMSILGMSPDAAVFGYRYVSEGELLSALPSAALWRIGAAPDVAGGESGPLAPPTPSPAMTARSPVSGLTIGEAMSALALNNVVIPADALVIHPDAAAERFLGVRELPFVALTTWLADRFGVRASLSEADRAAITASDPAIRQHVAEAVLRAASAPG